MRSYLVLLAAGLFLTAAPMASAWQDGGVTIERIRPERLYAEMRGDLTRLNFDVELANQGQETVSLTYLEMRLFDADGRVLARRYMGGNGLPGPIAGLPERDIAPGGSLYLFNPFPDLRLSAVPVRMRLRIFHTGGHVEIDQELAAPSGPPLARSPVDAQAYIYSGSDLFAHHRRVSLNSAPARAIGMERITQRFALDFTALDPETGDLASGEGGRLEDWYGYGLPVVAPVSGTVIAVRTGMPDNSFNAEGQRVFADGFETYGEDGGLGNYLILDTGTAYLLMAHFAQDSLTVSEGDRVEAGQRLGQVGLSGDTAYPHLHIQLQDGPDFLSARPLPILFACWLDQAGRRQTGAADTGDFIRPCAAG